MDSYGFIDLINLNNPVEETNLEYNKINETATLLSD